MNVRTDEKNLELWSAHHHPVRCTCDDSSKLECLIQESISGIGAYSKPRASNLTLRLLVYINHREQSVLHRWPMETSPLGNHFTSSLVCEALEQPRVTSQETVSCAMAMEHCGLTVPQLAILLGYVLKLLILRLTLLEMGSPGRSSGHMRHAHEEDSGSPASLSFLSPVLHCCNLDMKGSQISCVEGLTTSWWCHWEVAGW